MQAMYQWVHRIGHTAFGLTLLWAVLYWGFGSPFWWWLLLAFGLFSYHFYMRLTVANTVNAVMHNRADYTRPWFRVTKREEGLYKKLRVKHWKNKLPAYDPASFDPKTHGWDGIAQTTCQSELVHEINFVLSFLPVAVVPFTGSGWLLVASSLLGAFLDGLFVVMQRYNRARIVKSLRRQGKKAGESPKKPAVKQG